MQYKYELHCHTKEVSRCAQLPAAELVKLYKEQGYDGIVITDHYSPMTFTFEKLPCPQKYVGFYTSGYREALRHAGDDFSVMLGMELRYYATANDYLVYGITEEFLKKNGNLMAKYPKKFYKLAKEHGFIVLQAHPFRPGLIRTAPKHLDGAEIFNGKATDEQNKKAALWAKENGMKIVSSGSDCHRPANLAKGGIITDTRIRSNGDLLNVLRRNEYELIETH